MAPSVAKPIVWFYHAFGLSSIHQAGRNAYLIIIARTCRMFAYGTNALIVALFFAELGFSDHQIGLFMSLTLFGDVVLGTFLTLVADKVGRRTILAAGSGLMICSGVVFACFENFWILLFAAVVGVMSATGGEFGPFRSIEESMLSHLTTPQTRSDVLAWYVTISTFGLAVGSEATGRVVHALQALDGWTLAQVYHMLFWVYAAMGLVNASLVLLLTDACEINNTTANYAQLAQEEDDGAPESADHRLAVGNHETQTSSNPATRGNWLQRFWRSSLSSMSEISRPTRAVMYKLWPLLAVDSVADGMVPYPLTNYYLDIKFHPATSTLGDATSFAFLLGSASTIFAGPLARKIGLINTMVFTHIPSSTAVLLFPAPSTLWLSLILLFVRTGLNNMDQAPRSAFIAAVVKPEERTAVMGITGTVRTCAAMAGPSLTGLLAGNDKFWIAFVAAGVFRLAYDGGLWVLFVNMKLYQHEGGKQSSGDVGPGLEPHSLHVLESDEDEPVVVEMQELDRHSSPSGSTARLASAPAEASAMDGRRKGRLTPDVESQIRQRSRSPMNKAV